MAGRFQQPYNLVSQLEMSKEEVIKATKQGMENLINF